MKAELNTRVFPDIDEQLHCVAVKATDELRRIYRKDELSATEIKLMTDLTNVLLLVRKQLPHNTDKTDTPSIDITDLE